jgi:hypothetical protein
MTPYLKPDDFKHCRPAAWPENLAIKTPLERNRESTVKVSKVSVATRTSPKP